MNTSARFSYSNLGRRELLTAFAAPVLLGRATLLAATLELPETEDNIEGPYYKAGAPERADLIARGMRGVPLLLEGRVLSTHGTPLRGAILDFWQANAEGEYDNQGFTLRGRFETSRDGGYRLRTIVPRYYKAGNTIRPSHIHVKVSAPGSPLLTTQLYFRGAPYNYDDPEVRPALMLDPHAAAAGKQARFDFVLRHA
jgi:protocatechuate 3,4-dioxygenase beta subunit